MNGIERCLWIAVAVVFGNLGGTAYQKYVVPKKPSPVKYERKGEVKRVAEQPMMPVVCVSKEVGQALLNAYEASQEEGELTLLLFILLGACAIENKPEPVKLEI